MSLRLTQLRLRVETKNGIYGSDISFENGLVVLRANNSSGKSICIQAIIYALGLERMLGASVKIPFPHVMTKYLEDNGEKIPVINSDVFLEIRNNKGDNLTIKRSIKGKSDFRLVSTWNGAYLSDPSEQYDREDFFVRDGGAAQRKKGFHYHLASFIGWDLPTVKKFDGNESPLYMECIFPLMLIEQKHGWSGIQSNMPKFFKVQEVEKRSIEFLLDLEIYNIILKKQQLKQIMLNVEQEWNVLMAECNTCVNDINGSICSLPNSPKKWTSDSSPYISVYKNETSIPLEEAIKNDIDLLNQLESQEVPTVEKSGTQLTEDLESYAELLKKKEALFTVLSEELMAEQSQMEAIDFRLHSLKEDRRKNLDIKKIKSYGSVAEWSISSGQCPTCHKHVSDSLLVTESENTMSIDENISFIESQIETFKKMGSNTQNVIGTKVKQLNSLKYEISEIRSQIRAIKKALISDERLPSVSVLRNQISTSERINVLKRVKEKFEGLLYKISELADKWRCIEDELEKMPNECLSNSDLIKIFKLESLFKEQLNQYDFSSVGIDSLEISKVDYKPVHDDGFNLGFDISASDNIRIIWAYTLAMLELSRQENTNHLGLLIFDEPRQQGAEELSFKNLLKRASTAINFNQQILFATSDPNEKILEMLDGQDFQIIDFDGKIIQRIDC